MIKDLKTLVEDEKYLTSLKNIQDIIVETIDEINEEWEDYEIIKLLKNISLLRSCLMYYKRDMAAGNTNYSISNFLHTPHSMDCLKTAQSMVFKYHKSLGFLWEEYNVLQIWNDFVHIYDVLLDYRTIKEKAQTKKGGKL
ncbi:MAG: hypothetical protein LBV74_22840 [Tannerella sp.]|jgi:hypothetical protein|nr:hypothetical protein [Tannerella sp.]